MKQDQSTDQQLAEIIEFCQLHGLVLRHNFVDEAKSGGSTTNRDDFNRMIDMYITPDQRPNGLILWNYARLARDIDDAQLNKINIRRWGIVIHSLNDQVPEGNYGRFVEFFIDMSNEEKRRQTSVDAKRGLRDLVQKYGCIPGTPPRGFKREKVEIGERRDKTQHIAHKWVPDPAFKFRIKQAFQMRAERLPIKQIHEATKLFSSVNSYTTFFSNPIYKGELRYSDMVLPNYCEPMVTIEIWEQVQKILQELSQNQKVRSSKRHPRTESGVYLLSGISKCGHCGAPHYGHSGYQRSGNVYLRYACTNRKRTGQCNAMLIPGVVLENLVLSEVHRFFDDPQNVTNMLTMFHEKTSSQQDQLDEEMDAKQAELATIRKAITNLTNAIAESGHSPSLLKKLSSLEDREKELIANISKLKSHVVPQVIIPSPEMVKAAAQKIKTDLQSKDRTFVHHVLMSIIDEVRTIREDDTLRGTIAFYHTVEDKKKAPERGISAVSLHSPPVGAPIYRHRISFEAIIPSLKRPKKKPLD